MKRIVIMLALLLGFTANLKAQEATYYITGVSYLNSEQTEWSSFGEVEGILVTSGNKLTIKVPAYNLDLTLELELVGVQSATGDQDKIAVFSSKESDIQYGIVYCPHYDLQIFRVVGKDFGLQFTYSKYKEVKKIINAFNEI